ncbi:exonuclease domain-containing protein [Peribacillus loiseleuriae]|uniref:exonuclease domain-containing protein n=1 Tax=Peribacillus loiseleuriae TaxID=1679170 RepID=UPI003805381E
MNAIIFDLELNKTFRKGQSTSIVEIGAVKVNLDDMKVLDTFQVYVMPHIGIRNATIKMIKMSETDIKNAVTPNSALCKFIDWIGEDYFLCCWGNSDKLFLINECSNEGISLKWLKNYNDIQPGISNVLANRDQMKLKDAINQSNIEVQGNFHSGLYDAIHTAMLMIKHIDIVRLDFNSAEFNYSIRCPLYKHCKNCSNEKYYTQFQIIKENKRGSTCTECVSSLLSIN